jgi:ABC-type lipoprotein export system ATPase subunit
VKSGSAVIEARQLRRDYPMGESVVRALDGVDLTIFGGELCALVGASGSGKTTLLSLLGCLDQPTSGSYKLAGTEVSTLDADGLAKVRNTHIGFVFQAFHLLEGLRADENVALPLRYGGVPRPARLERARAMLDRVGLGDRLHHTPAELSGGQRQRVAVARALVTEPALILADEPTGNLDRASGAAILALFHELHAEGRTVVLVTHDEHIAAVAERRVRLEDGRIVSDDGAAQQLDPAGPLSL